MKVKLSNVRLSFPDLFQAAQFQGTGPFNYRAALLVKPGSAEDKAINAAINEVAKAKWNAKAPAILKSAAGNSQKFCYTDGDAKEYDGYAGMMALSTTRAMDKGRPLIIDQNKSPLTEKDGKPYAGCYVNASVEFWAQDNQYGKTVRCTLLGLQFYKDGDAFGGGSAPSEDDFEDLAVAGDDDLA